MLGAEMDRRPCIPKRDPAEPSVKANAQARRRVLKLIREMPDMALFAMAAHAGICTEAGELTPPYRDDPPSRGAPKPEPGEIVLDDPTRRRALAKLNRMWTDDLLDLMNQVGVTWCFPDDDPPDSLLLAALKWTRRRPKLDPDEPGLDEDTRARRRVLAKMERMSGQELRALAIRDGICTPEGELIPLYRGDAPPSACRPTR
jgi:hypothetical protein